MSTNEGYYADLLLAAFSLAQLVPNLDPKIIVTGTAILMVYVASDRSLNSIFASALSVSLVPNQPTCVSHLVDFTVCIIMLSPFMFPSAVHVAATVYFTLFGMNSFMHISFRVVSRYSPKNWNEDFVLCRLPYFQSIKVEFTRSQIVRGLLAVFFGVWYACQKHWFANNILVLAMTIQAIEAVTRFSFKTHTFFLVYFFLHNYGQLNGVYGDTPIMFLFPTADSTMPFFKFEMIDISIPGQFIAKLLRYDIARGKVTRYFEIALFGYFAGLVFTIFARTWFEAAKHELLFIGPVLIGFVVAYSIWDGHTSQLWAFKDLENDESSREGENNEKLD